jgi:hypothetical protein
MLLVPRAGFEPATTRSSAERSPRLSYLGKVGNSRREADVLLRFLNSSVEKVGASFIFHNAEMRERR